MFYVAISALGIFLLMAIMVFMYFRLFSRLIIEIVDSRHSFGSSETSYVQNAVLFAYKPVYLDQKAPQIISTEEGGVQTSHSEPKIGPAPARPFLGVLGTDAIRFASKFGVRTIGLCRFGN